MPAPGTIAPLPPHIYEKCRHGIARAFDRCTVCEGDEDLRRAEDELRAGHPGRIIEAAINARRRWFDRCAFCRPPAWSEERHADGCEWAVALVESEP